MRVWFNHWFSTAYHLIKLMGEGWPGPEKLTFVGSRVKIKASRGIGYGLEENA